MNESRRSELFQLARIVVGFIILNERSQYNEIIKAVNSLEEPEKAFFYETTAAEMRIFGLGRN